MARLLLVSEDPSLRGRWRSGLAGDRCAEATVAEPEPVVGGVDAVLIDLRGQPDELIARWRARHPDLRLLAMVPAPDATQGLELLRQGVRAYCNRQMSPALLRVAVDTVLGDEIWAGRLVLQRLLAERPPASPPSGADRLAPLTDRERDVALGVARGASSKVLADEFGVSERTIKAHLTAIYRKTGCRNRVQLALAVNRDSPSLVGHG